MEAEVLPGSLTKVSSAPHGSFAISVMIHLVVRFLAATVSLTSGSDPFQSDAELALIPIFSERAILNEVGWSRCVLRLMVGKAEVPKAVCAWADTIQNQLFHVD